MESEAAKGATGAESKAERGAPLLTMGEALALAAGPPRRPPAKAAEAIPSAPKASASRLVEMMAGLMEGDGERERVHAARAAIHFQIVEETFSMLPLLVPAMGGQRPEPGSWIPAPTRLLAVASMRECASHLCDDGPMPRAMLAHVAERGDADLTPMELACARMEREIAAYGSGSPELSEGETVCGALAGLLNHVLRKSGLYAKRLAQREASELARSPRAPGSAGAVRI